jgi:hypothetical protein
VTVRVTVRRPAVHKPTGRGALRLSQAHRAQHLDVDLASRTAIGEPGRR